ncbi:ABC transporter ATP-binding protein [Natronocalculus amylovorans]|uniref:ABC transporter ATP-binding protein/permease n=1 Tax=Natronocalculus amylovorans TaxID=2917812 RepID=A0AAE3FWW8_9EURY|nr:ABC transporter ATP-binding protein [Natronocalculus amylovorans]MCL9817082.1 ABC transporter ATP-binding protein/permease [Natronocalculus amylovorans]
MSSDRRDDNVFDAYRERVDRPLLRLFQEYGLKEIEWFTVGMVANVIARVASLLPPLVLGVAIDAIFNETSPFTLPFVPQAWIPATQAGQFQFAVALIVGSFVVTGIFTWIYGVAANNFAHRVMHDVRTDSFEKMQQLDMTFFDDKQTGEVLSVLNNDASNLEVFLDNALQNSARLGVMVLGIAGILFYLNWQLALITLVFIPAIVLFTLWFMHVVEPRYVEQRASVGDLNTRLENALSGVELVKTSNTAQYEAERVESASMSYFEKTMTILKLNYIYRPGMELLAGLSFAVTFIVGGVWIFQGPPGPLTGELTVGVFVTFILMTQRFVTPLAEVSNIIDQYENAKASSERVFGLMDIPVRITDDEDAIDLPNPRGEVTYQNVSFRYASAAEAFDLNTNGSTQQNGEYVIQNASFTVDPGSTTAFVGPTGAGKSTLLKLLLRLYDVTDGEIRVDGHDIRSLTVQSLRESIGYVSQETYLFDGTIRENIEYGRFDSEFADVVAAATAAEAHEFIERLPKGYDTRIGERGVKLSGGQKQRLSIARTVLQDPEILILDEATSAVDTETEMLIQRSLDRLATDRTTFIIAHRLSTIKNAETICVLDNGEIVERGGHDELLAHDGIYAKLWRVQAGEIDSLPESFLANLKERQNEYTQF